MTVLYHITSRDKLQNIAKEGLRAKSYWSTNLDLAGYYKETVEDDGDIPVVLVSYLNKLDPSELEPDYPGIYEPITTVLRKSEEEVQDEWESSKKTWQDSVEIIHSLRVKTPIPATNLYVADEYGGECDLIGYAALVKTKNEPEIDRMNKWLDTLGLAKFKILHSDAVHDVRIFADHIKGLTSVYIEAPSINSLKEPKELRTLDSNSKFTGGNFYKIMDVWKTICIEHEYKRNLDI